MSFQTRVCRRTRVQGHKRAPQATHAVAPDLDALTTRLPPDLLPPVDHEVACVHSSDLDLEFVLPQMRRRWQRERRATSGRGDLTSNTNRRPEECRSLNTTFGTKGPERTNKPEVASGQGER